MVENSETALAKERGVSGTVTPKVGIKPVSPTTLYWGRPFTPADALKSALGTQGGIALGKQTLNVYGGQWITVDAAGKAIIATAANTLTGLAWPVWGSKDRLDLDGGLTALFGKYVAETTFFDKDETFAVGDLLKVGQADVTIAGVATTVEGCLIKADPAVLADVAAAVARVEKTPFGVSSETPDGVLLISSL